MKKYSKVYKRFMQIKRAVKMKLKIKKIVFAFIS